VLTYQLVFFLLFFWLDIAFLLLGIGYLQNEGGHPNKALIKAGGLFGLLAAFWAWYNAWAGIADSTNRYDHPRSSYRESRLTLWQFLHTSSCALPMVR
jgi:succinate-acetate transporter protein